MPSIMQKSPGQTALASGGIGALVACCALKVLIIVGIVAGISGLAIGGLAIGAGLALAVLTWIVLAVVRRRVIRVIEGEQK